RARCATGRSGSEGGCMGLPELYWLPEAERFAERLAAAKAGDDPAAALAALRGLAGHRLGFIETARLDRAVQAVLPRIEPDAAGPRVRLALVAATTVDHLVPAIRVGCLRRGLIADIYVAPLAQHRQELIDPGSGLHRFDPEVVLLMPDAASLLPALPLTTPAEAVSAAL